MTTQVVALVSGEITLGWPERVAIVSVLFVLLWKGITAFCCYWMEQEQKRMAGKPMAPGLRHRKVS